MPVQIEDGDIPGQLNSISERAIETEGRTFDNSAAINRLKADLSAIQNSLSKGEERLISVEAFKVAIASQEALNAIQQTALPS